MSAKQNQQFRIGISLTPEIFQQVETLARDDRRSLSGMCKVLIERGLVTYEPADSLQRSNSRPSSSR